MSNLVIRTIMQRRSIRAFQPKQVKDSDLELMLECAVNAPSACNMQSWHFTVIQEPEIIKYLNDTAVEQLLKSRNDVFSKFGTKGMDLLYGAPTLIIVSGSKKGVDPLADCSAAVQNMLICAQSLGVGTLWNGLINHAFYSQQAREKARIPDGYTPYFGVAAGYAKEDFVPRNKFINREGVVDYITE